MLRIRRGLTNSDVVTTPALVGDVDSFCAGYTTIGIRQGLVAVEGVCCV